MGAYDLWTISGLIIVFIHLVSSYSQSPYSLCFESDNCYLLTSRPLVWANSYYDALNEDEAPAPIFRDQDEDDVDIARIIDWKVGLKVAVPWKATLAQPNPWPGGWSKDDDDEDEEEEEEEEEDDKAAATNSTQPVTGSVSNNTVVSQANATKVAEESDESDEQDESSEEEGFERWLFQKGRSGMKNRQHVKHHWSEDQPYPTEATEYFTSDDPRPDDRPEMDEDFRPVEAQGDDPEISDTVEDQGEEQNDSETAEEEDDQSSPEGTQSHGSDEGEEHRDEEDTAYPEEAADSFTREDQSDKLSEQPAGPEMPEDFVAAEQAEEVTSPELMDYLVEDQGDEQVSPDVQQAIPENLSPEERLLLMKKKILLKKAIVGKAVLWKKKKILAKKAALLAKKKAIIRSKKKFLKKKFWKKKKKFLKKKRVWTKKKIIKAAIASQLFNKKGSNKKGKPEGIPAKKKNRDPPSSSSSNPTPNSAEGGSENEYDNTKLGAGEDDSLESGMPLLETVSESPGATLFAASETEASTPSPESSGEVSPVDEEKPAKGKGKGKKKGIKKYTPRPVNLGLKADLLNRFNQVTSGVTQLFSAFRSDSYEDSFEGDDNTLAFPIERWEFPYNYYYPVNKEIEWKRFYPVTLKVVYRHPPTT